MLCVVMYDLITFNVTLFSKLLPKRKFPLDDWVDELIKYNVHDQHYHLSIIYK